MNKVNNDRELKLRACDIIKSELITGAVMKESKLPFEKSLTELRGKVNMMLQLGVINKDEWAYFITEINSVIWG